VLKQKRLKERAPNCTFYAQAGRERQPSDQQRCCYQTAIRTSSRTDIVRYTEIQLEDAKVRRGGNESDGACPSHATDGKAFKLCNSEDGKCRMIPEGQALLNPHVAEREFKAEQAKHGSKAVV